MATEIVTATFREAGYAPTFVLLPWHQAERAALESDRNSDFRGSYPWVRTDFRTEDYYFSRPFLDVDIVLFYNARKSPELAATTAVSSLYALPTLLPGTQRTYHFPPELVDSLRRATRTERSELEAFEQLLDDTDDAAILVPAVEAVGRALVRDAFPTRLQDLAIIPAEDARFPVGLRFMASRRNPHNLRLVSDFDRALETLEKEGRLPRRAAAASTAQAPERIVRLTTPDGKGFVTASRRLDDAQRIRLPRGTAALVVQWSAAFLGREPDGRTAVTQTQVQILNGPLQGRTLFVEDRFVELR